MITKWTHRRISLWKFDYLINKNEIIASLATTKLIEQMEEHYPYGWITITKTPHMSTMVNIEKILMK